MPRMSGENKEKEDGWFIRLTNKTELLSMEDKK